MGSLYVTQSYPTHRLADPTDVDKETKHVLYGWPVNN